MGKLDDLYGFTEKRFTSYNHSLRVFIYGSDVSAWLKGNVTITYSARDGFNTASFDLANPRRIFQIAEWNLCDTPVSSLKQDCGKPAYFKITGDEYSEQVKKEIFIKKQSENIYYWKTVLQNGGSLSVTSTALGTRGGHRGIPISATAANAHLFSSNPYFPPRQYEESKYRLYLNDCIFNKNDYIRIFSKNPFKASNDEWVEVFCGFIQDHPISTNFLTGESTVRITATCVKQQLQRMRVNVNKSLGELDAQPIADTVFYHDFINNSEQYSHPFANASLEDAVKTLILGTANPSRDPKKLTDAIRHQMYGNFKLGNLVCYNPASPGNTLERWHLMTVFGVNKVPFPKGGNQDDLWLTTKEMNTIGANTFPDKSADAVVGGPSSRYLHMLLPAGGTGPGTLVTYDTLQHGNASAVREWSTRWEVIRDLASKLDFQVLTSPSGDLLLEFPQYGFTPCAYLTDFGAQEAATPAGTVNDAADAAKSSHSTPLTGSSNETGSPKGFRTDCHNYHNSYKHAIAPLFVYRVHQKEETLSDEAEDFPTILTVTGGMAFHQTSLKAGDIFAPRGFVTSPLLVDRYGVIAETVDFPFAGQRADDQGTTDSTIVKRLTQLGLIEFTKRMADASTWSGSLVYRPFMFPNRPIQLGKSNRIGLTTNVTYTWVVGQSASMSINCHMLMGRRHDGSFRLITGSVNTPIDYGAIWHESDTSVKDSSTLSSTSNSKSTDPATARSQAQPAAKPGNDAEKLGAAPGSQSLDGLMPEFRTIVENLIALAADNGTPVIVTSAFRTPEKQAQISEDNATSPYRSPHELGLAVDLVPASDPTAPTRAVLVGKKVKMVGIHDYQPWADFGRKLMDDYMKAYPDPDQQPNWGGNSPGFWTYTDAGTGKRESSYDYIHYQAPKTWGFNGSSTMYKIYDQLRDKKNLSPQQAREKLWQAIRAHKPNAASKEATQQQLDADGNPITTPYASYDALPADEEKKVDKLFDNPSGASGAAAPSSSPQPSSSSTSDVANSTPAPPCAKTDLLTVRGLTRSS